MIDDLIIDRVISSSGNRIIIEPSLDSRFRVVECDLDESSEMSDQCGERAGGIRVYRCSDRPFAISPENTVIVLPGPEPACPARRSPFRLVRSSIRDHSRSLQPRSCRRRNSGALALRSSSPERAGLHISTGAGSCRPGKRADDASVIDPSWIVTGGRFARRPCRTRRACSPQRPAAASTVFEKLHQGTSGCASGLSVASAVMSPVTSGQDVVNPLVPRDGDRQASIVARDSR